MELNPFVPSKLIGQLTLEELGDVFYFTITQQFKGFHKEMSPTVKEIIKAMEEITNKIRGCGVLPASSSSIIDCEDNLNTEAYGDIDALNFLSLQHMFGKFIILRLVPDGHRGESQI